MRTGGIYLRGTVIGRTKKITERGVRYTYTVSTGETVIRATLWGSMSTWALGTGLMLRWT
jgi:hypothetical protein